MRNRFYFAHNFPFFSCRLSTHVDYSAGESFTSLMSFLILILHFSVGEVFQKDQPF